MKESRKPTLMQLQVGLFKRIIISAAIMSVMIIFVYFFKIPNPNMILIAGLVLCSALFGFGGGITSAVIMFAYTLFFFSEDNSFIHFTPENMQKVFVSFVGIVADMLLVCFLKKAELEAFNQVGSLTQELNSENELLQHMLLTDALTGIRNRMALDNDEAQYIGKEINVMMLDLNDFKQINDNRGHKEGDRILKETGSLLSDTFGINHCYRYGGDEFLIIVPDISGDAIKEKLDLIMNSRPIIDENMPVGFSLGYVRGVSDDSKSFQKLITDADMKMYEAKRNK